MSSLARDLPHYRANIRQKISDIRGAGRGGSVEQVAQTVKDIQTEIASPEAPKGTVRQPVIVQPQQEATLCD
jgi:hypothetical protein